MNLVYKTFQSGNNRFSQGKIRKIRFTNTEWWLFSDGDDNCNNLLKYTHPYWNYPICQGKLNSHFCKHVCDFPFPWAFSKYDNFFFRPWLHSIAFKIFFCVTSNSCIAYPQELRNISRLRCFKIEHLFSITNVFIYFHYTYNTLMHRK